jgi:hypothetical protein
MTVTDTGTPTPTPTTTDAGSDCTQPATANGFEKIEFKNGAFIGLSEEQRVRWQEMFDDIRIPDQVARAAAWLEVNRAEREAIERQGEGFGSFIVRWLLREVKSPHTGHAS